MKPSPFRLPKDMTKESRVPVSARIKESSKETLAKAAKKNGISFALLLANIIDDYAGWYENEERGK